MNNAGRHIPERFLRQLWKHRHFHTAQLHTTDGRPLEIIAPGDLNRNGGPDFLNARVRIDGTLYRGDIELHRTGGEWLQHEHNEDAKYNSVILHVVLSSSPPSPQPQAESRRTIPVLELRPFLASTHVSRWNEMILREREERRNAIRCADANDAVDADTIREWIGKLATERFELKIRRYEERLRELVEAQRLAVREHAARYDRIRFGLNPDELPPPFSPMLQRDFSDLEPWLQLFYEGFMEALGYSKNSRPFLRLAKNLTIPQIRRSLRGEETDTLSREALLFGAAGLLPTIGEVPGKDGKYYVRQLKDRWRVLKARYQREVLSPAEWQFFRLRPKNFPTLRLAGAAQLLPKLLRKDYLTLLVSTVKDAGVPPRRRYVLLEEMFVARAEDFWREHYRFGGASGTPIQSLIGKDRSDDIILNVVAPFLLLYARIFKDRNVREEVLRLLENSPPAPENSILRQMDRQLVKERVAIDSSYSQQGLLRLHKQYCSQGLCGDCAVGKIVFPSSLS